MRFCSVNALLMAISLLPSLTLAAETVLWDDRPASGTWESSWYPVGNGAMGAMMNGGTGSFVLQFNEKFLWTGDKNPSGTVSDKDADINERTLGDYQNFGEVRVSLGTLGVISDYRRELDLGKAVYADRFTTTACGWRNGFVRIRRRVIASRPDGVIAFELQTDAPVTLTIWLTGVHGERTEQTAEKALTFGGRLKNALGYRAELRAFADAGKRKDFGNAVEFNGARRVVFFLQAKTSYDPRREDMGLGGEIRPFAPWPTDFDTVLSRHVADYGRLFAAATLALPEDSETAALTTAARLGRLRAGKADSGLAALLFAYGRYLLISSSRPGSGAANLQGVWNNVNTPPWHSDYHTNINVQMNYWGADATNLGECFVPFLELLHDTMPGVVEETRRAFPKSEGFAYRTALNPFGGGGWRWNYSGAPWLAVMAYDHYRYTRDRAYLEKDVWPLLRGAMAFFSTLLKERPDGSLVVANGWSPEHGPREDAVAHDHQLLRELLKAIREAQAELKGDPAFAAKCADVERRLTPDRIGRWGQLQEWETDRDEKGDSHRHTSQLFALYPGTTISADATPTLYAAARVALEGRALGGDSWRSWTWPWRTALWARLGNGAKAGEMIDGLLRYNTLDNLFTTHVPFQIDGNLGIVGAIAETLVQSHEITSDGKVLLRLLPALPDSWKGGGFARGFRARGGFTLDLEWKDGRLTSLSVNSACGTPAVIKAGERTWRVEPKIVRQTFL